MVMNRVDLSIPVAVFTRFQTLSQSTAWYLLEGACTPSPDFPQVFGLSSQASFHYFLVALNQSGPRREICVISANTGDLERNW